MNAMKIIAPFIALIILIFVAARVDNWKVNFYVAPNIKAEICKAVKHNYLNDPSYCIK